MVNVQYLQLPCKIKAVSTKNNDDSYTVILNSKLSYEQHLESYIHELKHITNEDHEKYDVDLIELKCRG